ncbi:MAG: phosphoadenosine phosphosulfate reductase [Pegethrix bostrychoides GSE-TBD4-15B]|jgi:phosphoadenosine phosphosulfate reductase|uniref:Phosphoadenosine 5'-phosphosulfate reductase n=1 Tax=Pegethrix bostrychoides GSE-TBD4-15B TaxID=2839662 RepID=A0A951PDR7_9CYAN|nr:phosphoadenosine phosphosulfate reductase [Pegethrix bostrychoides GSE-TBD4-15B]
MSSDTITRPQLHSPLNINRLDIGQLDLEELNRRFATAHPVEILAWCIANLPAGLVQTSSFGVDGMVIMDILYHQLKHPLPVLFLDTLHHFPETLALVAQAQRHYDLDLHVYRAANTQQEFAAQHGEALWERDVQQFHLLTKIEPLQRGLAELKATAWMTGRRRDQSANRAELPIFERDTAGRLKINPLAGWTQKETWRYVAEHGVPYNPLHNLGYASIGDQPLTTPTEAGEEERAGRWRGTAKTECGIHG